MTVADGLFAEDPGEMPQLFTLKQVARLLGVSYYTIFEWVREGRLRTIRLRRFHRVHRDELQRILRDGLH